MANDLKSRPWIIDTFSATNVIKYGQTFVTGFVFRNYTGGAGSLATIRDMRRGVPGTGLIIATLVGNAAQTPVGEAYITLHPPIAINDISINADSGQVEVIVV